MLPFQFFAQNFHFAINLFAALVFFAVFWLYLDAWSGRKAWKELCKWSGFLLLAVASLVQAAQIEQSVLGQALLGDIGTSLAIVLKIIGYIAIIFGQIMDPLQPVPTNKGLVLGPNTEPSSKEQAQPVPSVKTAPAILGVPVFSKVLLPFGSLAIAFLYFRRATTGLERHLHPVAKAFLLVGIADLLSLAALWRGSDNPLIINTVGAFGWVWFLERLIFLAGVIVLGYWVWNYLIKRFQSQLFIIFTSSIAIIFLVTTVGFTYLILDNIQRQTLDNLTTASKVLEYSLASRQSEARANTETLSQNPSIVAAVQAGSHQQLVEQTANFLASKKQSSLIITNDSGRVLVRAEDPDRWGDSYSSDALVRRALIGQAGSSVQTKEDVVAPLVYIKTGQPIRNARGEIIGSVMVGTVVDSGFVDGIKNSTGLDSAVYSGNVRSATTLVAADGKSRLVGVKEESAEVKKTVLKEGKTYSGLIDISNRPFLVVYTPLKDADNVTLGMLQISQPHANILQTAGRSIELTFLIAVALMVVATLPAFVISRYLANQLK